MISISSKRDCCGCGACVQCCLKSCIAMKEDEEGFLYPEVDLQKCTDCHLCEKVCPIINRLDAKEHKKVYAVKNPDLNERMNSSSGGIFIAIAKAVIAQQGVVFGAVYDGKWGVVVSFGETLEQIRPMMGSKYMQARIETAFQDAEKFLKTGRLVMFTGSPCQIAGLHGFLRKDYPNLLTVDFLCHGVPSPGVWRRYLNELHGGKSVKSVEFRNKSFGWKNYRLVVRTKNDNETESAVLLSTKFNENAFMRGFLSDVYLRPSCYGCRSKNGRSRSDLTIADYWGIERVMPDFDDDKGVSLVIINSERGQQLFLRLSLDKRETDLKEARKSNGGFNENLKPHPKREEFYKRFANENERVDQIVNNILEVSTFKRLSRKFLRKAKRAKNIIMKKICE